MNLELDTTCLFNQIADSWDVEATTSTIMLENNMYQHLHLFYRNNRKNPEKGSRKSPIGS